ncbi:hypothetical protein Nepgr_011404 [Nepenthes gracilis]|uniref:Uncharacterized protein n=1 Tax=Nepenthes gracilis TaxID=150966 RepID=A0AAD3SEA1_NEPGR|nr:hypothetical protein Nepgr_011404 [Nepenthes gracilis]
MANGRSPKKSQRLFSSPISPKKQSPSKFCSHFLCKALVATLLLILVPLFPSQAPDFINQPMFTRSWELMQLLFVGIAVSYGLFSRINDDSEGERISRFDNAQSYVSRLLHVPSSFDEEFDYLSGSDDIKVQTWSSHYYRNEPIAVVAEGTSVLDDKGNSISGVAEHPLLLPVRSLKSGVLDGDNDELVSGGDPGVSRSSRRSNSSPSSRELSKKSRNDSLKSRVVDANDFVYVNRDAGVSAFFSGAYSSSASEELLKKPENGSSKSRFADANDLRYANGDDGVSGSSISRFNSTSISNDFSSHSNQKTMNGERRVLEVEEQEEMAEENVVLRSPIPWRSRPGRMEINEDIEAFQCKRSFGSQSSRFASSESQAKILADGGWKKGRHKPSSSLSNAEVSDPKELRRIVLSDPKGSSLSDNEENSSRGNPGVGAKTRNRQIEGSFVGKSVRTTRALGNGAPFDPINKKAIGQTTPFASMEKRDFADRVMRAGDGEYDSESRNGERGRRSRIENKKAEEDCPPGVVDEGRDVDKKADEFIAKFREQIRLQRIESIKISTGQIARDA